MLRNNVHEKLKTKPVDCSADANSNTPGDGDYKVYNKSQHLGWGNGSQGKALVVLNDPHHSDKS